jgi:hypothetical protein
VEEEVILVELISPTDTLAFYPTPDVNGWVYDNDTLDAWYAQAEADPDVNKRPNAHGAYGLGQIFTNEHRPIISGQYYGASAEDALSARDRLAGFFNDGESVAMRVTDEARSTTREVWLVTREAPFHFDFSHFDFDVAFVAPDPRRYAAAISQAIGMPSAGTGLVWNLGTAGSGLYFDWGTAGVSGQVSVTNTGRAASSPRIEVGAGGAFAAGFRITEVETGRELIYSAATNLGDVIVFDSRTRRATISNGGGDVTGLMTSREWFEIPAGATYRYQINPLDAVSGAPTMTVYVAPAYL